MAHMYPKSFPRENKSGGEKKVFQFFKDNAPDNWYILHSFRLPAHLKVIFGESDFIVIAPRFGIFTLEIKSGGVGFDGTDWLFINREHKVNRKQRGPFEQAREGMFEVERIIKQHTGEKYNRDKYLYGYGVIFTDEDNFPVSALTEDEPWRLMQKTGSDDYCAFVRKLASHFKRELISLGRRQPYELTEEDAALICSILRPEVECVPPMKSFIDYSEEDIIKLTDEQFRCLDDIELNDRTVVLGGAGTGKTLLALEDARRANDTGKKVAVFCYNKNLAKNIRKSLPGEIDVYSFHAFMTKICGQRSSEQGSESDSDYFEKTLPLLTLSVLKEHPVRYSKIIIDEFQDLCLESFLKVINVILEGELFDGCFTFYGDFAKQAIFYKDTSLDLLGNYTYFTKKKLSVNCRNTKNIGNEIVNVTGYEDSSYLLSITGEPVDYYSWKNLDEEKEALKKILKTLKTKGISSKDIMILSPRKRTNSVINELDPANYVIGDINEDPKSYQALFSTVQAFKGLESKVVIVTDIDDYSNPNLMYVALSRARSKMYVLESVRAAKQRKAGVIGRN